MAHSVDPTHVVGIWVGRRRTMSAGRAQRLPSTDKLSQSKQLQISVAIFASAQRHNVGARSVGPMRNANGRRTYICAIGGRARWHAHLSGSTEHDQERTIVRSGTTGRAGIARVHRGRLLAPNDRRTSRRCRRDDRRQTPRHRQRALPTSPAGIEQRGCIGRPLEAKVDDRPLPFQGRVKMKMNLKSASDQNEFKVDLIF